MWESPRTTSHRRDTSVRSILTYVLAVLIAALLWVTFTPNNSHAAEATWNSGTITYERNPYSGPAKPAEVSAMGFPKDTTAYTYVEPATATNRKMHVIYFAPGVDPGDATEVNYKTFDYKSPTDLSNGSTAVAIEITPPPASPGTSSCEVTGGLGYIICPITNTLSSWMDWVFNVLVGFLEVPPTQLDQNNAIYRAWTYMRTFANIAFVIAFLIIIYSQLTSFGVSNYGIKKLLPRIIVAAILVNMSYIICALAIDISNVLGHSIQNLFIGMRNTLVGTEGNSWQILSFESLASFVLSGGALASAGIVGIIGYAAPAGIIGSLALLLPSLLGVFLSVLVALLIMAARQALVTVLTILAPLAFVAYLLPNTEKWFSKWSELFMTMLILFPAFSVIFGGSQFAGAAIIQNADSINTVILGMVVQVAPLLITPMLIKLSGSLLGRIAGMVNNPNKGLIDRTRNWSKDQFENRKARRMATQAPSGLTGALQRTGQRMEQNRRRREGMRSAYTSLADSYFGQSEAGQEIKRLNHRANFEKDEGDIIAHERWNREMHDPNGPYRARRVEQIRRQSTGDLYKTEVESEGKQVFHDSVLADRALRMSVVNSHEFLKRAELSEGVAKARAEAHWNHLQLSDTGIRELQLDKTATTLAAKRAEEQWNMLIENITAKGSETPDLSVAEKVFAAAIKKQAQEISVTSIATSNAKRIQNSNLSDVLLKNTERVNGKLVQDYAAGIDPEGATAAVAFASNQQYEADVKLTNERAQIMRKFELNGSERQQLATGKMKPENINGIKKKVFDDNGTLLYEYIFKPGDKYAQDAAIDMQLSGQGAVAEILEIIAESGSSLKDFKKDIAAAIPKNGIPNKAAFTAGAFIDRVLKGKIESQDDIATYIAEEYITGGKFKAEQLAQNDPAAISTMIEAINEYGLKQIMDTGDDENNPSYANAFAYASLRDTVDQILSDRRLLSLTSAESQAKFNALRDSINTLIDDPQASHIKTKVTENDLAKQTKKSKKK